ncbi:MAG: septum formation initiator family protein [Planctomycetes bacterium]|nr:septum formation initiator family protein [Planctomycetota bacterium]
MNEPETTTTTDASAVAPATSTVVTTPTRSGVPFDGALSLRWHGVPVLTLFLLGFAFFVVVGNYLPTRADTASTIRGLDEQRRENRELAERIRRAENEAERLEKDPWTNERILRDQLHMSRKGEVIIR